MGKPTNPKDVKKPAPSPADFAGKAPPSAAPSASKDRSAKLGCHATACKAKDERFNFCEEHFRQFKFGLITKSGDPVSDYERKLEHYQHWLKSQKVA